MPLSLSQFVDRWRIASLSESSGAQSHFIDLCDMLGVPHPAAADATGETYTFEKSVSKTNGGEGYADVWKRDYFAWEYKGKKKDLKAAYKQLNDYREDLFNPPLLVVSDMNRFEIHTNFGNTSKRVYAFDLKELGLNQITAACPLPPLDVLRALFDQERILTLRPEATDAFVTQEAARDFSRLAERLELEKRALTDTPVASREQIAHFLMRLLFCLFADNTGLLPKHVFRSLIQSDDRFSVRTFRRKLTGLFAAMSEPDGIYGEHTIKFFNGGLFNGGDLIDLDLGDLAILHKVATRYNWSHVAPAIFGTLFERSLNAERRSLIGAHYTSEADIELIIEPVVMKPLRERWAAVRESILAILTPPSAASEEPGPVKGTASAVPKKSGSNGASAPEGRSSATTSPVRPAQPTLLRSNAQAEKLLADWFDELAAIRILDPACGSGNFLYVALRKLLDLWLEARDFAIHHNIQIATTYAVEKMVSPQQLFGIETEFYAHELASIVVWIGFLQWKHEHGILEDKEPILQNLTNIEHNDAILRYDAEGKPYEPTWPKADFIIGNPPFLGGKLLRRELGDKYVDDLFALWSGRVKAESDLVVYWFEKARAQLEASNVKRVGLLATQGIRGGANRNVLERIQQTGTIFWAWSDRKWLLEGAAVHVSMIAFERVTPASIDLQASAAPKELGAPGLASETWVSNSTTQFILNGDSVPHINADLTTGSNTASARRLHENQNLCFMGTTKVGPFDIDADVAAKMLSAPINPNGRPNSDVVRPWINSLDITRRPRNMFIIDFGTDTSESESALYELPFEYIQHHVRPFRRKAKSGDATGVAWWRQQRPRPEMRRAILPLRRYIGTPSLSKHRLFLFVSNEVVPDHQILAIARADDYFIGVLHSAAHELWALTMGTQLENRPRYTPESTFATYPFPWPPGTEPSEADSPTVRAIADAARELVRLREHWLNPLSPSGKPLPESELKDRTLTKLYNLRTAGKATWLENAHRALDQAVYAAYGWALPPPHSGHPRAPPRPQPRARRRQPRPKAKARTRKT